MGTKDNYNIGGVQINNVNNFSLFCLFSISHAYTDSCSQINIPLLLDKVDYGIGLSYRPASLCSLTGRYGNPMR